MYWQHIHINLKNKKRSIAINDCCEVLLTSLQNKLAIAKWATVFLKSCTYVLYIHVHLHIHMHIIHVENM